MNISIWIPRPWATKKDESMCRNCKHYYQHYVRDGHAYKETHAGHCAVPRMKAKEAHDSCKYFERRQA